MLNFKKEEIRKTVLDPGQDFAPTSKKVEIRQDPLTGDTGRLAHFGMIKPQKEDISSLDSLERRQECPFCPANLEYMAAKFSPDLIPEGRIYKGEAVVNANVAPYDRYNAITVMSKNHIVPLEEMSQEMIKNALLANLELCQRVAAREPEVPYYHLGWNYMPPSGGSLVHPHQQVLITYHPGNLYRKVLESSKDFHFKHGVSYWQALLQEERKRGERYIGETGEVTWLTSYVPLGVLGEFIGVFPGIKSIFEMEDRHLEDMVAGLQSLFDYFLNNNIYSFNMGLYSAPGPWINKEFFNLHLRVIPRTFLNLQDRPPDNNIMQVIFQEPYSVWWPEVLCQDLRPYFKL